VPHGLIPQELIEQIRDRLDITDVVSSYLTLTKTGQNFKGLCPFHAEKTPSFTVSPVRQIFHCFGCGVGGNVFTFVMKMEGTEFPETVRELGRRAGITVPVTEAPRSSPGQEAGRARLEQLHEAAAAWFQGNLQDPEVGREASAYLAGRGIAAETVEEFRLGWAPPAWDGLIRKLGSQGYSASELALAGLTVAREGAGRAQGAGYYDRFRGRLMIPITDLHRRVIAFGGRGLADETPKYLNSPETPLFSKGRSLFGMDRAREAASRANSLIIVEGYFDAISLHQAGIKQVAATLGTALTPDHVRTIRRFVQSVVLLFDPDPAGVRAALRTLELFVDSGIAVRVVSLPDGQDPDVFIRANGPEAFLRLHDRAPSLLDFAVERSLESAASGTIEDRIRSVDEILRILQKTSHRIVKEECIKHVAERLGIGERHLIERYPELRATDGRRQPAKSPKPAGDRSPRVSEEHDLAHLLLQGLLDSMQVRALDPAAFTVPECRRIIEIAVRHLDPDGNVQLREVLNEALEDSLCGGLAAELSLSERHYDNVAEHVRGCLQRLERKRQESALRELIAKLRLAEREGRAEDVRRLNAEVNELRVRKATLPAAPTA
jgi:DNA primase